ncbi:FTR1 family protein [Arthrobacter sp. FW306-05-C]|uniref:iron uptake transporter permease EfeU n=1 Tax=unclassified Arthrobacter TaxID=235627 RepID=UPI001EF02FE5|nr:MULTISPECIES: iron uptake transporter permease EfeU [unclassified Arthrobacter]UKA65791.1 FTR1 family protein [Arthrobacter sp. FW306-05-C]UKA74453.1 FTR1 family protein [Arthrobacter sp. FW306-07-I]
MTANFLIGLREGLEATLVVVLLMAYLAKTDRRHLIPCIWAGVAAALAVSAGFGALLTFGPRGLTFEAQEAIGGGLSILAVGLVTWMVFWMARTARTLGSHLKSHVDKSADGTGWGLAVVAAIAVGREGLETALFLWAAAKATGESTQPLAGAVLGLLAAAGVGYLLHRGVLRVNLSRFFTWTGAALVIIAGGVLSYGIHDLQEAGLLPGLHSLAFDISVAVPPSSWYGTLLKGTLNFSPATTWLEAGAWLLYVLPVLFLYLHTNRKTPKPTTAGTNPAGKAVAAA